MPEHADSWSCNNRVDQGKVEKYTRCKLVCQKGYDLSKGMKLNKMICLNGKIITFIVYDLGKRRDFHRCKRTGEWLLTSNVILSCKPNGFFFSEKLRIAMNQIQSFEIDNESLTRLNHELRIENENYHQIALDFKNETDQCQFKSEECFEEKNLLENNLQQCSSEKHDSFQPAGQIGISVIRRVENARETDTCVGTITSSGYITSSSCCQADQLFLFEFENSTEIVIEENSIWIEEHICFINITSNFKFHFPILDDADTQNCTILAFDNSQGEFIEKQIEVETKNSVDSFYSLKTDFLDNSMVLDGTLISCNGSSNFGIVSKSK